MALPLREGVHPAIADGNVAVVTGAALGIGRAIAGRFVSEGMRVALLDLDGTALHEAAADLGPSAVAIPCNVASRADVEAACERVLGLWGQAPSILVNNAATRIGKGMDASLDDWRALMDVNLWGVVHGVRAFLPVMQAAGQPGAVVNVGSKQGITNPPGHPAYNMSKAAVKTLTECLEHDLRQKDNHLITAHLLVPGFTANSLVATGTPGSWTPEQVADRMMEALGRGDFYVVCPDDEVSEEEDRARIAWAAGDITEGRPALSRWHPDWSAAYKATRG
ncbi:MAG: SDR family NAD(P)-dependent oxidoreductase [Pseudomonadota bacterium]